ncbi:hypothetical protein [Aeromicrobium massiliense]|uniref:hypothetical protein n=1 Tax=Aeromicrobium massiliense TaxID=1464554 RepID=UPI0002EB84CE|nr:hypothetical protein [Aeromicrobium massiliense]
MDQAPVRPARRLPGRTWRDPRLLVALALVLGATVGGARLVASQDDTVAYWAVADDVRAAGPVSADQLEPVRARLDADSARHYLTADEPPPLDGRVWARDVPAGSLVDASAFTAASAASDGHELPLKVEDGAYPADLSAGDRVDVWAGPAPGQGGTEPADRVLSDARVVAAGEADPALGQTARTVVVAVGSDALQAQVVAAVSARHVTLVRVR